MKTKIFKITFLIFIFIYIVNGHSQISDSIWSDVIVYMEPDTCYPGIMNGIPSRDLEPETIWLSTGWPASGGIPYDIVYVEDEIDPYMDSRIFIYTERKLLSINMFDFDNRYTWGNTIELTEFGSQTLYKLTQPILPRSREKHLAYNPDKHELYCLTQDLKIFVIDPYSVEKIGEIIPSTDISLLDWAILKYDPFSKLLFLGLSQIHSYTPEAELIAFNTTDYSMEYSINDLEYLDDYAFNPVYPITYLSSSTEIQVRNTLSGSIINTYTMDCDMGVIFNAFNASPALNKTYCLPESESISQCQALIFNGNDTSPQTMPLEKGNFGCGTYNAASNKVYIGYTYANQLYPSGFMSFNPDGTLLQDNPLADYDIIMDMVNLEERVFITTKDHIYCCKNGTYYSSYTLNSPDSYFYRIAATIYNNIPRIWATSMMDQSLQVAYVPSQFSNIEWYEPELISGAALQGFFNHSDQKLYCYYGMPDGDHKFMYIYDPTTEDIASAKIDHDPTGVVIDEETNTIYFSTYQNNFIKRYEASSNSWLEPIILPEGYSSCYEMYLSNRLLYCTAKYNQEYGGLPRVLVYDTEEPLTDPEIIYIPGFIADPHRIVAHYTVDEAGRVYVSVRFAGSDKGRVFRINDDFSIIDCGINFEHPDEILFDHLHDKILLKYLDSAIITILNFEAYPPSFQNFYPREGYKIIDMEIDPLSNLIYFDYNDPGQNGYIDIYTTDGTFMKTVQVGYRAMALKYNPLNGLMYVHVPVNFTANRKEQIWSIAPASFDVYSMDLEQNEGHWRNGYYLTDLIHDDENNKIYTVSAHGNIKVITCSKDQITLDPGKWNWISFPRLEREGDDPVPAQPILEGINPFPDSLTMLNRALQNTEPPTKFILYKYPNWSGDLLNVQSTYGYKLIAYNEDISYLPMTGSILDPETEITIYDGHENWVGYFLPETQSPFDAIPEEVLSHLKYIRAQYWSCLNYSFIAPPPKSTESSIGNWRCECNQGRIEMQYNDMVILMLGNTEEQTFSWNRAGSGGANNNKVAAEYFVYKEKEDYEALFIDLDSIDLPDEIGAFAGDSCIGATKVLPGDTSAMICAYTQGFEGEEISFELIYPTKATRPMVDDYLVFNDQTRINENRKIRIGEKKQFYLVSFSKKFDNTGLMNATWIHCLPNPARDEATIVYFVPDETSVRISLANILGKEIRNWDQEQQTAGEYNLKFKTSTIPAGYYLVSLTAGNQTCAEKLLIIH